MYSRTIIVTLFIILNMDIVYSQVIRNIFYQVLPDNKIEINYTFEPYDIDAKYKISAFAILDNLIEFELESVEEDIGSGILGGGQKTIIWDVLDQLDFFQGKNIRFKIVAEKQISLGETIGGAVVSTGKGIWFIFAGSDETQNFTNGLTLLGGYPFHKFQNDTYKNNTDNGIIKFTNGWGVGFKYLSLPLIISCDYTQSRFIIDLNLPYDKKLDARFESINGELNFTFLPLLKEIIPSAGVGVQYGLLHKGDYKAIVRTPSAYFDGMIQLNLAFLSVSACYRKSFASLGENKRNWDQIFLSVGIHFKGNSSSETM